MTPAPTAYVGSWIVRILLGTFDEPGGDATHLLIREARAGQSAALTAILRRVEAAASTAWPLIVDATVVPVPGHAPGATPPLVMTVARQLAAARGWAYAGDALRRVTSVTEAKAGGPRDVEAEVLTLVWTSPVIAGTIILVDDVVRTGATLDACKRAIDPAGDQVQILAVALAAVDRDAVAGGA